MSRSRRVCWLPPPPLKADPLHMKVGGHNSISWSVWSVFLRRALLRILQQRYPIFHVWQSFGSDISIRGWHASSVDKTWLIYIDNAPRYFDRVLLVNLGGQEAARLQDKPYLTFVACPGSAERGSLGSSPSQERSKDGRAPFHGAQYLIRPRSYHHTYTPAPCPCLSDDLGADSIPTVRRTSPPQVTAAFGCHILAQAILRLDCIYFISCIYIYIY